MAHSFPHSRARGKVDDKMSQPLALLHHRVTFNIIRAEMRPLSNFGLGVFGNDSWNLFVNGESVTACSIKMMIMIWIDRFIHLIY